MDGLDGAISAGNTQLITAILNIHYVHTSSLERMAAREPDVMRVVMETAGLHLHESAFAQLVYAFDVPEVVRMFEKRIPCPHTVELANVMLPELLHLRPSICRGPAKDVGICIRNFEALAHVYRLREHTDFHGWGDACLDLPHAESLVNADAFLDADGNIVLVVSVRATLDKLDNELMIRNMNDEPMFRDMHKCRFEPTAPIHNIDACTFVRVLDLICPVTPAPWTIPTSTLSYSCVCTEEQQARVLRAFLHDGRSRRSAMFSQIADSRCNVAWLRVVEVLDGGTPVAYLCLDLQDVVAPLIVFGTGVPRRTSCFLKLAWMILHDICALAGSRFKQPMVLEDPDDPITTAFDHVWYDGPLMDGAFLVRLARHFAPDPLRAAVLRSQLLDGPTKVLSMVHDVAAFSKKLWAHRGVDQSFVRRMVLDCLAESCATRCRSQYGRNYFDFMRRHVERHGDLRDADLKCLDYMFPS